MSVKMTKPSKFAVFMALSLGQMMVAADVPPCIVGAVQEALNPVAIATVCEHPDSVASDLVLICGTKLSMAMSVFSAVCRGKGTPISGNGKGNYTAVLPAMVTVTTAVSTTTVKVAPGPATTMLVIPIETHTYLVSPIASNVSTIAAVTTAYPTAPIVGGSGVNASAVKPAISGNTGTAHGSGLVVEPDTGAPTTTSGAETTTTSKIHSFSSAALAALATGDMGPVALALGAGLLGVW